MNRERAPEQLRPPWQTLPLELRAPVEYLRSFRHNHPRPDWPQGQGQTVLVIPGFGQSDSSTQPLRRFLQCQGFSPAGWQLGRNKGLASGMTAHLLALIESLHESSGERVSLVGWSLGGIFARELARKKTRWIDRVITLGSPIAGGHATTVQALLERLHRQRGSGHDPERYLPPPVPCTAIYTRSDGIVAWPAALEPDTAQTENIEVRGSHMGLGFNPAVWYAVCHRLSPITRELAFAWPEKHVQPPGCP